MIDMNFASFLTLLVISLITALIVHYGARYCVLTGVDGFLWKWIVGWVGAWLGTPVLGHWFQGVLISNVYIVPAFLGGLIGAFIATAIWKAEAKAMTHHAG
jgi:uncharacterized membrane protein YeaQ/YmgE (transglycosylase-associated protein family)